MSDRSGARIAFMLSEPVSGETPDADPPRMNFPIPERCSNFGLVRVPVPPGRAATLPEIKYDRNADVLSVRLGKPVVDWKEDHPRGLVLGFAVSGNFPTSVMVKGFHKYSWDVDLVTLGIIISQHLGIEATTIVRELVEHEARHPYAS